MVVDNGAEETRVWRPSLLRISVGNVILAAFVVSTIGDDFRLQVLALGALVMANSVAVYQLVAARVAADDRPHSLWILQANSIAGIIAISVVTIVSAIWTFSDLVRGETTPALTELVITMLLVGVSVFVVRKLVKRVSEAGRS